MVPAIGGAVFTDVAGGPVDISRSAYEYRADRPASANPPESWLALMHFAHLPLNRRVDVNDRKIKQVLCGFLWEEIRPVQSLQLIWSAKSKRIPPPAMLRVTALVNRGASSSWWNNLDAVPEAAMPSLSEDGRTYRYELGLNTCGLLVSLDGDSKASEYDVPQVRVLTPQTWQQMDLEVEWGFDAKTAGGDYSGKVETYDGRVLDIQPLKGDASTQILATAAWRSSGKSEMRRGIRMSLLYTGQSKWRQQQEYTTQADDVARTIVTIWTKSGNFSFLAADLDNGPILAPEYGFFVRRTSPMTRRDPPQPLRQVPKPFKSQMTSIAGSSQLRGWGSDETPWFGANPAADPVSTRGITLPAKAVAMHPGQYVDVVAEWTSPIDGPMTLAGSLTHAQAGGNGVEWWIAHDRPQARQIIGHGTTDGKGNHPLSGLPNHVEVKRGERLALIVGPKGDHRGDTTILDLTIQSGQRVWNLARDVGESVQAANPHADRFGSADVWMFGSEPPMSPPSEIPSVPPIRLASNAQDARSFEAELRARNLHTIREQTRAHVEQTWLGAVTATRGADLPSHPAPPAEFLPAMQVIVPSGRLTAQWNLGAWHLLRHCAANPKTGRRWFNDYPYGILAAETYLVLTVLDQMGAHDAAADGFDQWLSLPLDQNPPSHPVGLFSDGHGSSNGADGPPGYGGNMDVIHAFGPGSIGWALTQHYWMTGDKEWLKANEPRLLAGAEWMLRQRHVIADAVPGGDRMWAKGLQPAMQVTPDSGGLWMNFYECEAYYWAFISRLAETLAVVDPPVGAKLKREAEAYGRDLRAAVGRSIALSPVVPVRDGTFHSVIPFACYVRGSATGAWGWQRDGSGTHVGPLYWDTVQTAAALISPAGLLAPQDVRVQGYLDVLEDRFLLENKNVGNRDWFDAGWQYQGGLERTANMHLAADDIPVFLRSFLNCYAVDILPKDGYVFNEHAVHGPPDKIFEEAAFLERFRNLLVMEEGKLLWLARGTPREWLEDGKRISVEHAPTQFGDVSYDIASDLKHGVIRAKVELPARTPPDEVRVRFRHPTGATIESVTVDGRPWTHFDRGAEVVNLHGLTGTVSLEVRYRRSVS